MSHALRARAWITGNSRIDKASFMPQTNQNKVGNKVYINQSLAVTMRQVPLPESSAESNKLDYKFGFLEFNLKCAACCRFRSARSTFNKAAASSAPYTH
jgi:hypothetical protein